uniref:Uncharacterized protein n=1 Tax=Ixodes ricinus TaxID=34613 RepID=A0A6B0UJG2_IXORI
MAGRGRATVTMLYKLQTCLGRFRRAFCQRKSALRSSLSTESNTIVLRPNHFLDFTVRKRTTYDGLFVDFIASDRRRVSGAWQFLDPSFVKCARCSVSRLITSATMHLQPL